MPDEAEIITPARVKLEPGMLLLSDRDSDPMGPRVYSVKSKRVLLSYNEGIKAESTLTHSEMPDGWVLLDPDLLGRFLAGNPVLSQVAAR